jgi:hypothetical protein
MNLLVFISVELISVSYPEGISHGLGRVSWEMPKKESFIKITKWRDNNEKENGGCV